MCITNWGLSLWAEGYSTGVELCENGILRTERFCAWSSPALLHMHWNMDGQEVVFNIDYYFFTVPVPLHQREAVDAIIEHYYKPQRAKAIDQT